MKKYLFLFSLILISIQCGSAKMATESSTELSQRDSLETLYKVPTFSSQEIQDFAYDFIVYFEELKKAKEEDNDEKLAEIQSKTMIFNQKSQEIGPKMTTEDASKFTDWTTVLMKEIMN